MIKQLSRFFVILAFLIFSIAYVSSAQAGDPTSIRVLLMSQADSFSFGISGSYQLIDQSTGKLITSLDQDESFSVSQKNGQLLLQGKNRYGLFKGPVILREENFRASIVSGSGEMIERYTVEGLSVLNAEGERVPLVSVSSQAVRAANTTGTISGSSGLNLVSLKCSSWDRRYRGSIEFRVDNGEIAAVNELDIEDYLRGVVPCEIYSTWPVEALKAQAVASRNYALQRVATNKGTNFYDLSSDKLSQIYNGYDFESKSTNQAVEETGGMVMLSKGSLISSIFHSSSGGYTENSEDVWTYPFYYLKSKADPYDKNSNHYNWQVKYTAQQLIEKLNTAGYKFSKIKDIKETERTASGARIKKITVTGEGPPGGRMEISNSDKVRNALGLKSALFTMEKVFDKNNYLSEIVITGSGNGHGLGMSQYGACGMAKQGYNYQEILKYYYTGIVLVPNYGKS